MYVMYVNGKTKKEKKRMVRVENTYQEIKEANSFGHNKILYSLNIFRIKQIYTLCKSSAAKENKFNFAQ